MYEIPILFYYFEVRHCTAMGCTKDKSSLLDKRIIFLALVRISECSSQLCALAVQVFLKHSTGLQRASHASQ